MKNFMLLLLTACLFSCSDKDSTGPKNDFVEPEMVIVPGGEFVMADDIDRRPSHLVNLDEFFIGKFEVTNNEYMKFLLDNGYSENKYWSAGGFGEYGTHPAFWILDTYNNHNLHGGGISGNGNYPVVGLSWDEAMAYCSWLSDKTGKTYRLPTEAEWEKASRGTGEIRYPWGNEEVNGSYANYMSSGDPEESGLTPVGFFDGKLHGSFVTTDNSSPYGAYDMAGNAWEWCLDWYGDDYYQYCINKNIVDNPKGPESGLYRVIRGGSWDNISTHTWTTHRGESNTGFRDVGFGFRLLREK